MGIKRRCQSCGEPYTAERDTSMYCSPRCRKREDRKRQAGDPAAIPARRTSTTTAGGGSRTVTLMLSPGTSVELPPDLAAKIAPHLPVPGVDRPAATDGWERDERPLRARQRTGDAPWEEHPWEVKPEPPAVASAGADDGSTPASSDGTEEVLSDGSAAAPHDGSQQVSVAEARRRDEQAREARVEHYSQTEEDIWEMLQSSNSIASATRTDLGEEGIKTPWGRNALMLAMRLDYARLERASAVASLSREWRAALREAKDLGGAAEEDEVTAAARRRRERIEAAQREAAAAAQNGGA